MRAVIGLREKPFTSEAIERIGTHWSPILGRYNRDLTPGTTSQPKAIKDSVWGMIDLAGREVVLLDSPPLQRLRRIRQLGLCFLTFPTATHSRFEHTLGVIHQSERMINALVARSEAQENVLRSALPTIRLAALLHDVGHLPLSHVTERYYSPEECTDSDLLFWATKFRNEILKYFESPKVSLSECLSVAFVLLPEFWNLLVAAGYSEQEIQDALTLIAGVPFSAERAFAQQVISDVLDADKLDYMFRDAQMTGVPLSVDLEILLYKLGCYQTPASQIPPSMRKFFGAEGVANIIGTSVSGFGHAKDVILARSLLHERVYHHHKVLAAERLALEVMAVARPHPADFLCEDDRFFSSQSSSQLTFAGRYFSRLLETRRLPKRLFAVNYGFLVTKAHPLSADFSANIPQETPPLPEEEQAAFALLHTSLAHPNRRVDLARLVREIAQTLALRLYKTSMPKLRIWIDSTPRLDPLTLNMQVRTPDGGIWPHGMFRQQAAAFPIYTNSNSYVYCSGIPADREALAFIAVEVALYEKFRVWFGADSAHYAKQSWSAVEATKRNIEAILPDWFSRRRRLRPKSEVAASAANATRLAALARSFHEYSGPGGNVDVERIRDFLDQFPEELVPPMIEVLENVTFLDRKRLGLEFSQKLARENLTSSSFAPLSHGLNKSAAVLPYMMSDSGEPDQRFKSLEAALLESGDITFYEDCVCSGFQPRATVQTWFGLPPDVVEPDIGVELTEAQRSNLQKRKLHFRFVFSTTWGMANLRALIADLALDADVDAAIVYERERSQIYDILQPEVAEALEIFLRRVGVSVLRSTKQKGKPDKWTDEICEQRCFGYGNKGLLVASSINCPTSTVTALWKSGEFEDVPWLPLFPRRFEGPQPSEKEPPGTEE